MGGQCPRLGSWRIQWGWAKNCRHPWPTGDGLIPRDPQTSEAFGYIAASSYHSHVGCRAELSDEQYRLVDFIYRLLWLSDQRCALAHRRSLSKLNDTQGHAAVLALFQGSIDGRRLNATRIRRMQRMRSD